MVRQTQHINKSTLLFLTALIFVFFSSYTISHAAQDDTTIDGYELPDMFEDDTSTALPTQNTPDEFIKPQKSSTSTAGIEEPQPIQTPSKPTFTPLNATGRTKTATISVLPTKRPSLSLTPPEATSAALKNNDVDMPPTIAAAPMPVPMPASVPVATPVTMPVTMPKTTSGNTVAPISQPQKLAYGGTLPLPVKRPIIYKKYKKSAQKASVSKTGTLIMPAVPAGEVSAAPLAQPEITLITAITSDLPADIEGIESIDNISIQTELESSATDKDDIFDVSQSMQSESGDDSYPLTPAKNQSEAITKATTASLFFIPEQDELSSEMKKTIEQNVIPKLLQDKTLRIEIKSYADAPDKSPSSARRLSLSRALALRTYLLSRKIDSYRMDVRALGNSTSTLPVDRIDVSFIH
jgi:outer membrane protein OmpA-like peptidoglycan-associated protein